LGSPHPLAPALDLQPLPSLRLPAIFDVIFSWLVGSLTHPVVNARPFFNWENFWVEKNEQTATVLVERAVNNNHNRHKT
tara:strand:- start:388 stop:624 length:237 start_codon:yes stop_codon:yes gene_type:complete